MSPRAAGPPVLVVVGGGLSGLVAAHQARRDHPDARIVVVEATDRLGGKLDTAELGSGPVELGAEAFIVRRPEAADLVAELGLTPELRHPSGLGPALLSGGRLHPMPAGTFMGIPSGPDGLAGLLEAGDLDRVAAEAATPLDWTPGTDRAVGELVRERFGPAVLARLVDPMLGGVYAAPAVGLGTREVVPALAAALDAGASSLTAAVRGIRAAARPGPVFATFAGGYRVLVDALAESSGAEILRSTPVRSLRLEGTGVCVELGGDPAGTGGVGGAVQADAVVLAVPVPDAASLLSAAAPATSALLGSVRTATSAVVALEVDRALEIPQHSGVLVATDEPVPYKALTFSSRKWPHLDDRPGHLVRVSFGRLGDAGLPADAELEARAVRAVVEVSGGEPRILASRVRRWTDGLPEIGPGHSGLVQRVRTELGRELPGVALAGAATDGVGVPACIGAARAAARAATARWQD